VHAKVVVQARVCCAGQFVSCRPKCVVQAKGLINMCRPNIDRVGQDHIYTVYTRYGIFGREVTKYTAIYGVFKQFWPTLIIECVGLTRTILAYSV
jgi:hypothetical protein